MDYIYLELSAMQQEELTLHIPVHLLGYYRKRFGYQYGDYPVSENYYERAISIPLYPSLTDAEVEKVEGDIKVGVEFDFFQGRNDLGLGLHCLKELIPFHHFSPFFAFPL